MSRLRAARSGARGRVVVIGAGHNGLVAAFYLARAGFKPLVLGRRDEVGGGAITGEVHRGFLVPTLSHECRLEHHIVREMELERHGLERLDGDQRVFAPSVDHAGLLLVNSPGDNGAKGLSSKDLGALAAFLGGSCVYDPRKFLLISIFPNSSQLVSLV